MNISNFLWLLFIGVAMANAWTEELVLKTSGGSWSLDIGESAFNEKFWASSGVIKRECHSCRPEYSTIYYKRLTDLDSFAAYSYFRITWASSNNVLGEDFELYSNLTDLEQGTNQWTYCDYDETNIGAFRNCGHGAYQWVSNGVVNGRGGQSAEFYILTQDDVIASETESSSQGAGQSAAGVGIFIAVFLICSFCVNGLLGFALFKTGGKDSMLFALAESPLLLIIKDASLLIEDMVAVYYEDDSKMSGINAIQLIQIQFVLLLVQSWLQECAVSSAALQRVTIFIAVCVEYVFAILLTSWSSDIAAAGCIIAIFTIFQVAAEIPGFVFAEPSDSCMCIPSVFRMILAPRSLDQSKGGGDRQEETVEGVFKWAEISSKGGGCGACLLIMLLLSPILTMVLGSVALVECGPFPDWLDYWWTFFCFVFAGFFSSRLDGGNVAALFYLAAFFVCLLVNIGIGFAGIAEYDLLDTCFYFFGYAFIADVFFAVSVCCIGRCVLKRQMDC